MWEMSMPTLTILGQNKKTTSGLYTMVKNIDPLQFRKITTIFKAAILRRLGKIFIV